MAYEVTATRRRPQQFSDLSGQDFVAETLTNSIQTRQIAHAYLFTGPRGCGKTSTARILAKALNCQNSEGPTTQPCGQCESCKAITNSSSLDVIEIDGASNTGVNDVRQIKDEVMFPPASGRYKIYIIDEVHMLSDSAFNALLKTIEEPPAHVIFIFATTELQKVPATIKSRCQQYNFRLVPAEKLKNLLADACAELNIQAENEALYWIAKESGGSVRDAYTLFDQVAAFSQGHITFEKIRDKLGLLGTDRLNAIFRNCAASNSEEVINQLDQFLQSGISIDQLISNSSEYLRSLLLIKNGITKESILGQSAERFDPEVVNAWNVIQVERAQSIFLQLYRDIRYSVSPKYELELAFSRLCWLKQYVSPAEVKAAIDKAKALLNGENPSGTEAIQNHSQIQQNNSAAMQTNFSQMQKIESVPQETAPEQPENNGQSAENPVTPPQGMPHFSALEKLSEKQEMAQNPFNQGGALPPENSAAPAYQSEQETSENPETSEEQADYSEPAPQNEVPPQYDDFETPPDDEYPPEDDIDSQQEDIHKNETLYEAPDGTKITMTKIFAQVVAELSINDALIASSLAQTGRWNLSGNKISTTISNVYQKNKIEQKVHKINSLLESICHSKMSFEIEYQENKPEVKESPKEIPNQVKILCNVFKGNVQGGGN